MDTKTLAEGQPLPGLSRSITRESIRLYAEASHDFNPIHLDEEFARQTPLGGIVAHGMFVLAFVSEMMGASFGDTWAESGRLDVRFREPARPDDTLSMGGEIQRVSVEEDGRTVTCRIRVTRQTGATVITGEASLKVKA